MFRSATRRNPILDQLRTQWARPPIRWGFLTGVVGLALVRFSALGRFPEWDEAVFFSQSGGFHGVDAPQLPLAASREGGTPILIFAIRMLGLELEGVRLGWLLVVLAVGLFAFIRIGRHFPKGSGEIGFLVFGLFWTTLAFGTGLYGSLIWGCLAVAFVAAYLDLIERLEAFDVLRAIGLGILVAAMFWMRSLESVLMAGTLVFHSVMWHRAAVWRRAPRSLLITAASFALIYVIPWAAWSTARWGSVIGRLEAVAGQVSGAEPSNLNGAVVYWDALVGGIPTNGLFAIKPTWVWPIVAIFLVASILTIGAAIAMVRGRTRMNLGLVVVPLLVLIVFFVVIYTDAFRDRYLSGVVPLFAAALGGGASILLDRVTLPRTRRVIIGGAAIVFGIWAVAQLSIADHYQHARIENSFVLERTVGTIRAMAGDQVCIGVSRYGSRQVQFGSGCRVRSATSIEAAVDQLAVVDGDDVAVFLLWPNRDLEDIPGLDSEWMRIDLSTDWRTSMLYMRVPACMEGSRGFSDGSNSPSDDCAW